MRAGAVFQREVPGVASRISDSLLKQCEEVVRALHRLLVQQRGAHDEVTNLAAGLSDKRKVLQLLKESGSPAHSEHVHELEIDLGDVANRLNRQGLGKLTLECWEVQASILTEFATNGPAADASMAPPGQAYLDEDLAVENSGRSCRHRQSYWRNSGNSKGRPAVMRRIFASCGP